MERRRDEMVVVVAKAIYVEIYFPEKKYYVILIGLNYLQF